MCVVIFYYVSLHFGFGHSLRPGFKVCSSKRVFEFASSRLLGTLPTQDHFKLNAHLKDFKDTEIGRLSATNVFEWLLLVVKDSCRRFPTLPPNPELRLRQISLLLVRSGIFFKFPAIRSIVGGSIILQEFII